MRCLNIWYQTKINFRNLFCDKQHETNLKEYTIMKKYHLTTLLLLLFVATSQAVDINVFFEHADNFFSRYVKEGKVDYVAIIRDGRDMKSVMETTQLTKLDSKDITENEMKAFYINAYNILVIKNVVDHYPIKSPKDVDGFFDKIKHNVAGEELTLNSIEKDKLMEPYKDARIHFVLACAAQGCPEIANHAYEPKTLDIWLDKRSAKALNDVDFIQVDTKEGKVMISEIFNWYSSDFSEAGNEKGALVFINKYRDNKIKSDYVVDYYPYNWKLNNYTEQ